MFNVLIQRQFGYACSAWYPNLKKKFKSKLQTIQNKCIRYCLHLRNRSPIGMTEFEKIIWFSSSERFNQYLFLMHLNFLRKITLIVIRNRKIWKHGPYYWHFRLNLKYLGWPYKEYIKNSEKCWLSWEIAQWKWFWGCFSHFLLLWIWYQRFWDSSENRYKWKRLSHILFVCYSLMSSQNIYLTYLWGHLWLS